MINKTSIEIVRNHLDQCLLFLTPFLPMTNCHMVTFITDNLYEKYVPPTIQNEMKSTLHIDQAMDIYWNHLNEKAEESKFASFKYFQNHLADLRRHTLNQIDNVWITPEELKVAIGCKTNNLQNIKGYMSEKKNHEVNMAEYTRFCLTM